MKLQKETEKSNESPQKLHGKWYDDACGTAFALELVGERWSLLIIRELMLGGRRFSDIRSSLQGISAKVLTERLASLEVAGVLKRLKLPPPAGTQIYELTEWGYLAETAIQELGRWAARSPAHNPQLPLTPVSLMLSMRTMLVRDKALKLRIVLGFDVGGEKFTARLADSELDIVRGLSDDVVALVSMPAPLPWLRVIYGHQPLDDIEREGGLALEGDRKAARAFSQVFALPPKSTVG